LRHAFHREDKGKKKKQLFHVQNVDKKKEAEKKEEKRKKRVQNVSFTREQKAII
jgi:hypothetical protein